MEVGDPADFHHGLLESSPSPFPAEPEGELSDRDSSMELQDLAEELRSYLADGIPPLLAADSIGLLIRRAPDGLSGQIQAWLSYQHRARGGAVSYAAIAFHALRKLHLLGELGLLPKPEVASYLASLVEALLPLCPPEERETLRQSLESLRHGPQELGALELGPAVAAGSAGSITGDATLGGELARELKRFSLLLARLGPAGGPRAPTTGVASEELAASLLSAATGSARDGRELGKYLDHLRELGVADTDEAAVVRTLSRSLPAWAPVEPPPAEALGSSARALHRFVDLGEAPKQRTERFREVVGSIVEQVNAGSLGRAVALVQVAVRLLESHRVPVADADQVLRVAQRELDEEKLRGFALDPAQQPLLRQLLGLFPGLRPEGLLIALEDEPDLAKRRLRMTLLEAHGAAARGEILERIHSALADSRGTAWYWQRNLVYLLHRIPCPPQALEQRELDSVAQFSQLLFHPRTVGEAITRLGQIGGERVEGTLVARLREVESALDGGGLPVHPPEDLERLRAQLAALLLRGGSASARRMAVQVALRRLRDAGDAHRVAELRAVDVSAEPELLDELLAALADRLPRKLLGVTLRRNAETTTAIVDALGGTPVPPVRQALAEVARRFPREPFGIEASKVLAAFDAPPAPTAPTALGESAAPPAGDAAAAEAGEPSAQRMEGDLELFGLPNLLQTLAQSELTGTLTLRDRQGATAAILDLDRGRLTFCSTGRLQGEAAVYQLLESPPAASFTFTAGDPSRRAGETEPREVLALLMEGMRRFDEYRRARAVVPDAAVLSPTGSRPTAPPAETDGAFVRELWTRVKTGADAATCETGLAADPYRVRSLLAHWLTEGAVTVAQFAPLPPAGA